MLLAVDIGNSSVNFGIFKQNAPTVPICTFSISTVINRTSDEYELLLHQLISSKGFDGLVSASVVSSVVPSVTNPISCAVESITGKHPFIIGSGTRTGIKIKIDNPSELGADIVSNAAAAVSIYGNTPMIIADLGTATTLTAINAEREILGTVIIPGAKVSLDALSNSAELLYNVYLEKPAQIIGKNSSESILSGVINGNVYMIDGFVRNLKEILCKNNENLTLIATGGLSHSIIPHCRNKFTIIDNLTIIGASLLFCNCRK